MLRFAGNVKIAIRKSAKTRESLLNGLFKIRAGCEVLAKTAEGLQKFPKEMNYHRMKRKSEHTKTGTNSKRWLSSVSEQLIL